MFFEHGGFTANNNYPVTEESRIARMPKSRIEFWQSKFNANQVWDARVDAELKGLKWRVLVIWECESKDDVTLA